MKKNILLCLIFLILNISVRADYITTVFQTKRKSSYQTIFKKYSKKKIKKSHPMMVKTMRMNPHVNNWRKIPRGTKITLYLKKTYLNLKKKKVRLLLKKKTNEGQWVIKKIKHKRRMSLKKTLSKYLAEDVPQKSLYKMIKITKYKNKRRSNSKYLNLYLLKRYLRKDDRKKQLYVSASVTLSEGIFTQEGQDPSYLIITSQASPWTAVFGLTYYFLNQKSSISSGLYYSKINPILTDEKPIPLSSDIGFNLYYQRRVIHPHVKVYFGLDYETFSTFNFNFSNAELVYEPAINSFYYLTFGISRGFVYSGHNLFLKLSASYTVSSSTDASLGSKYTGAKSIFYVNYRNTSINFLRNFFIHSFYKVHFLSNKADEKLSISRLGVGLGYVF